MAKASASAWLPQKQAIALNAPRTKETGFYTIWLWAIAFFELLRTVWDILSGFYKFLHLALPFLHRTRVSSATVSPRKSHMQKLGL